MDSKKNVGICVFLIFICIIPSALSLKIVERCNQHNQKNCDIDEFCDVVTNLCSSCSFLCDETDEAYLKMCKQMCPQVYSMKMTTTHHISHATIPVTDWFNSSKQAVPKGGIWPSSLWMTITSAAVVALLLLPFCTLKYCYKIKPKCLKSSQQEEEIEAMDRKEGDNGSLQGDNGSQDTLYIDLHPEKSQIHLLDEK